MNDGPAVFMDESPLERRTVGKVFWRLMPFLGLLYIVAFLDRVNVGFAALSMNKDLGFSNAVYGFGAGIFFIGYFLMEVPGNLIMAKVGARLWIARILITWGIFAGLTAFVSTPMQFYVIRFLLGVAEASFFPGIIYYLSTWNRSKDQAKAVAFFMMALPVCNMLGAPISTYLLGITWLGWHGWHWLFILEAVPAIILGFLTPWYLTNKPQDAKWLKDEERNWLVDVLARESAKKIEKKKYSVLQAFADRDVVICSGIYFLWVCGLYGFGLFLPILVKALSAYVQQHDSRLAGRDSLRLRLCSHVSDRAPFRQDRRETLAYHFRDVDLRSWANRKRIFGKCQRVCFDGFLYSRDHRYLCLFRTVLGDSQFVPGTHCGGGRHCDDQQCR